MDREMYVMDNQTGVLLNVMTSDEQIFYGFAEDPSRQEVNEDAIFVLKECENSKDKILKTLEANKDKNYNYWFFVTNTITFVVDYDSSTYDCDGELVEMIE